MNKKKTKMKTTKGRVGLQPSPKRKDKHSSSKAYKDSDDEVEIISDGELLNEEDGKSSGELLSDIRLVYSNILSCRSTLYAIAALLQ